MDELKPCPFCGENKAQLRIYDDNGWWNAGVTCTNTYCGIGFVCGFLGGGISIEDVETMTIETWNQRG